MQRVSFSIQRSAFKELNLFSENSLEVLQLVLGILQVFIVESIRRVNVKLDVIVDIRFLCDDLF